MSLTRRKKREHQPDGEFIEHISCPSCGSSDALAVYQKEDDSYDGYCWSCEKFVANPYDLEDQPEKREVKKTRAHDFDQDEFDSLPIKPLKDRKLKQIFLEYFNVRVGLSAEDGSTITEHYYPTYRNGQQVGAKVRRVKDKRFTIYGSGKDLDFFGQKEAREAGGRVLFVTEGELDAVALFQCLKEQAKHTKWEDLDPSVVSLPSGASAAVKVFSQQQKFVSKYKTVVLAFDQDEPGQAAAKKVARLLGPDKVKIADFSEKDPCDMVAKGKCRALKQSVVFDAAAVSPAGVVTASELIEEAMAPVEWGNPFPWSRLTEVTYGKHRGNLIIWGAGSGVGKTEAFKEMILEDIKNALPVGVIFLEEKASRTLKTIAGKSANKRFHIPGGDWTHQELESELHKISDHGLLHMYDSNGVKSWEEVKETIRYWALVNNIRDFYLDHLTALTADSEDERRALDAMLADMAGMAEGLDITFNVISHLTRPGQGRKAHEEGGAVRMADFRGSGAIGFWAHFIFALERNTQHADPNKRNKVKLRCLKDRLTGNAAGEVIPLQYSSETGRLEQYDPDDEPADDGDDDEY